MKSDRMVALTGGIGSGKTFISKIFEEHGIPVFNSDNCAKWVMISEPKIIHELSSVFGSDIYIDGKLNKERMGNIIFFEPEKKEYLEELIYPYILKEFYDWKFQKLYKENYPFVMLESAVLIKGNSYKLFNYAVLVDAPIKIREERIMARPGMTEKKMRNIMRQQDYPTYVNQKLTHAGITVYNIFNDGKFDVKKKVEICVDSFNDYFRE